MSTQTTTINLRAGKRYKTRNGLKTKRLTNSKADTGYKFESTIKEPECPDRTRACWTPEGHYLSKCHPHRLDLVEELPA
jgi:hypothetical protein